MEPLREQGVGSLASCASMPERAAAGAGLSEVERARLMLASRRIGRRGFDTSEPLDAATAFLREQARLRIDQSHAEVHDTTGQSLPDSAVPLASGVGGNASAGGV